MIVIITVKKIGIGTPAILPVQNHLSNCKSMIGTGRVFVTVKAKPLSILRNPRETRKDGILRRVVRKPIIIPINAPNRSTRSTDREVPSPALIKMAQIIPEKLACAPTERSISAVIITKVIPTAMMEKIDVILRIAATVRIDAKWGANKKK